MGLQLSRFVFEQRADDFGRPRTGGEDRGAGIFGMGEQTLIAGVHRSKEGTRMAAFPREAACAKRARAQSRPYAKGP